MSLAASPQRVHRPRRAAIRTALRWNLVPLALVVAGVVVAWTQTDNQENWALLVMLALAIYGGGLVAMSAGLGVAFAAALMRPTPHGTHGAYGHTITDRTAFRRGSLAAVLGWLTAIAGLVVVILVNQALTVAAMF